MSKGSFLAFDVETSGLIDYKSDGAAEHQPHIISIAAGLFIDGAECSTMISLIRPDGFSISDESTAIHGITQKRAAQTGIPIRTALSMLMNMSAAASAVISYGLETFDARVVRAELSRMGVTNAFPPVGVEAVCVKELSREPCELPDENGGYKRPSLETAYVSICRKRLGARTAAAQMRATADIYLELKSRGL